MSSGASVGVGVEVGLGLVLGSGLALGLGLGLGLGLVRTTHLGRVAPWVLDVAAAELRSGVEAREQRGRVGQVVVGALDHLSERRADEARAAAVRDEPGLGVG